MLRNLFVRKHVKLECEVRGRPIGQVNVKTVSMQQQPLTIRDHISSGRYHRCHAISPFSFSFFLSLSLSFLVSCLPFLTTIVADDNYMKASYIKELFNIRKKRFFPFHFVLCSFATKKRWVIYTHNTYLVSTLSFFRFFYILQKKLLLVTKLNSEPMMKTTIM